MNINTGARLDGWAREAAAKLGQGDLDGADALCGHVLREAPGHAVALQVLAAAAVQRGDPAAALAIYDALLAGLPGRADLHANRGAVLHKLGRLDAAASAFETACGLAPPAPSLLLNLGLLQLDRRAPRAALQAFDALLAMQPDLGAAHVHRARALRALGDKDGALASLRRAGGYWLGDAGMQQEVGQLLLVEGEAQAALACFDGLLAAQPGRAEAVCWRGVALAHLGRAAEAEAAYRAALALAPASADAHFYLALLCQNQLRLDEALRHYDQSIAQRATSPDAFLNRAVTHELCNRIEAALADIDRALALKPDMAKAHWNKALCLLKLGRYDAGWPLYEWRWREPEFPALRRQFAQPLWLGQADLRGRRICVHAEQGLGDSIQFCRYVRLLLELGARVVLLVEPALAALLRSLDARVDVVTEQTAVGPCDFHCPMLSLPLALRGAGSAPYAPGAYLAAEPERVAHWAALLPPTALPRVGLVWRGAPVHKHDRRRSMAWADLAPHLPAGCQYVSLQKEIGAADRAALTQSGVAPWLAGEHLRDFADTAALCMHLDAVVTVDTSVAHLAGALGRRTIVALPFAPDWRWQMERADSVWYPDTMLLRQARPGDWASALRGLPGLLAR